MFLLVDCCRCNATVLTSSLECLTGLLQEQQLHLLALPLLALWEHTSLHITHNRASTVLARITRVRVLAALGLMPQAAAALSSVMQGANLPGLMLGPPQPLLGAGSASAAAPGARDHHQPGRAPKGLAAEGKAEGKKGREGLDAAAAGGHAADAGGQTGGGLPQLYAADKWPRDAVNAGFLQHVAEAVLDPAVTAAYGPWLSGHLSLARAAFLAAAGETVDCWVDGKPLALAAAVRAGLPPAVDPGAAASSPAASSEAAPHGAAAAPAAAAGAKSSKPPAGAAGAAAGTAGAAVAAGKAVAGVPSIPPPPARTPEEFKLLDAAAHLLRGVVSTSCGASGMSAVLSAHIPWVDQGVVPAAAEHGKAKAAIGKAATSKDKASSSTGKGGHGGTAKGGKASPQRHGKGATGRSGQKQQQAPEKPDGADTAAAERRAAAAAELLAAQHQQLLVEALLQLAAVQSARWLPLQALPVCLAACEALRHAVGSSRAGSSLVWFGSPLDGSQAESKAALQPGSSTWLASRWQVGGVLVPAQVAGGCCC